MRGLKIEDEYWLGPVGDLPHDTKYYQTIVKTIKKYEQEEEVDGETKKFAVITIKKGSKEKDETWNRLAFFRKRRFMLNEMFLQNS